MKFVPMKVTRRHVFGGLAGLFAAIGLVIGVNSPVVEAPVVEAPVVEAPVVEAPVVEAPVVEALDGYLWLVLAMHFDGMKHLSSDGLASWKSEALTFASTIKSRGWTSSWEMTGKEVDRIGDPAWFASMEALGAKFAPRQPHAGDGTAEEALSAMIRMGVDPGDYIGSFDNLSLFSGTKWSILTGHGTLGHTNDEMWSGFKLAGYSSVDGTPTVIVGSGTANSVAIKAKVVGFVADGTYPWAVEVIRANGVALDGKGQNFVSPARHDGSQKPVSIIEDIDRVMATIKQRGLSEKVRWDGYEGLVARARATGRTNTNYVVPRTATE